MVAVLLSMSAGTRFRHAGERIVFKSGSCSNECVVPADLSFQLSRTHTNTHGSRELFDTDVQTSEKSWGGRCAEALCHVT